MIMFNMAEMGGLDWGAPWHARFGQRVALSAARTPRTLKYDEAIPSAFWSLSVCAHSWSQHSQNKASMH